MSSGLYWKILMIRAVAIVSVPAGLGVAAWLVGTYVGIEAEMVVVGAAFPVGFLVGACLETFLDVASFKEAA